MLSWVVITNYIVNVEILQCPHNWTEKLVTKKLLTSERVIKWVVVAGEVTNNYHSESCIYFNDSGGGM